MISIVTGGAISFIVVKEIFEHNTTSHNGVGDLRSMNQILPKDRREFPIDLFSFH